MVAADWLSDDQLEAEIDKEIQQLIWHIRPCRHGNTHRKFRVRPTFSMYMDVFSDALTLAGNPWSPEQIAEEFEHCIRVGGVPPDLCRAPQYIAGLRRGELVPNKPFRDRYLNGPMSLNDIGIACGWIRKGKQMSDTSRLGRVLGIRTASSGGGKKRRYERPTVRIWIPSSDAALLAEAMGLVPLEVGI